LNEELRADFAYVDTTKVFDVLLVDAFYLARILQVGGVLCFDDCTWRGVKKMVRYISQWKHFEVYRTHFQYRKGLVKKLLNAGTRYLPAKERVFSPEVYKLDENLGINGKCVALRKTKEVDETDCMWYETF
jgi:hypothetical protein